MKTFIEYLEEGSLIAPLILSAALAGGVESAEPAPESTQYKIQQGDTLSRIAKNNNTDLNSILKLNPTIKDPNKIGIGQTVSMPGNRASPELKKPKETKQEVIKPVTWNSLISDSEGMRNDAYWDETGKVWTIGKGSTTHPNGTPVKKGDKISNQQANEYMDHYVNNNIIPTYNKKIPNWASMNPNQQGALISFGYNFGPNFYGSKGFNTITSKLSSPKSWNEVPDALKLYNKSGGEVQNGLITRRDKEGKLWSTVPN